MERENNSCQLTDALGMVEERIKGGEFAKDEKAPKAQAFTKADLTHRVEVVTELLRTAGSDKSVGKAALIDSLLAVLKPAAPTK
jgi:hypothetical protein